MKPPSANALRDILVFGGLVIASIGVGCESIPAALVVFGGSVAVIGLKYK